jgi:excisionase family DNA binding protein
MTQIYQLDLDDLKTVVRTCFLDVIQDIKNIPTPEQIQDRVLFPEACEITGISESLMRKLCMKNEVPFERYGGRRLIFSRRELESWMESRTVKPDNPNEIMVDHLTREAKKRR